MRTRILFFAEAVTLAHLARPLALASALDRDSYDITIACDNRHQTLLDQQPYNRVALHSIPSAKFLSALARGTPVYDLATLEQYVEEDLGLIDKIRPDIVVGDFRLSLSVSARLSKVAYAGISNAYWSPYANPAYICPALPFVSWTGPTLATMLFRLAQPLAFTLHSFPLNRLRKRHGLPGLGGNLRRVYTDADYTLYADVPEMIPTRNLPMNHRYLGPVLWNPPSALPKWWDRLPMDKPLVYLTMGSSGAGDLLPDIIQVCADLPVTLMVAAAGRPQAPPLPDNVFWADYLPGIDAAKRASVVICNGGSPTSHQALSAGVPVLGIAGNLDQFLNMSAVVTAGAGRLIRKDRFTPLSLRSNLLSLLDDPSYRHHANEVAKWFNAYPAELIFSHFLDEIRPR